MVVSVCVYVCVCVCVIRHNVCVCVCTEQRRGDNIGDLRGESRKDNG
jgi:hypothetical protein